MESGAGRSVWMSVDTIMTKEVVSVRSTDKVRDAWMILIDTGITGAPVLDIEGNLIGVVSNTDIYRNIIERYRKARSLRELTTHLSDPAAVDKEEIRELSLAIVAVAGSTVSAILPPGQNVVSIGHEDSIDRALHLMAEHNVNLLPVTKEGKVVGIVSRQDIIWLLAGRPGRPH